MIFPTQNDLCIYENELLPFLPEEIIDCHVHVGLPEFCGLITPERMSDLWAIEVSTHLTWEDLRAVYNRLLPRQKVSTMAFGWVYQEIEVEDNNRYVLEGISKPENRAVGLMVTKPEWDARMIADGLSSGFIGIKPYPDFSPCGLECSIYDFLPKSHLAALNDAGGILMLHLPRKGRLADPENIREILEISDHYPAVKLIVAHIGRSFCLPTAKESLPIFAKYPGILFDTAANLNSDVFRFALETLGPDRILFGTDLPITLMRGVREHVGNNYVNYSSGDYSWNTNRKSAAEESSYTYYMYEELRAIIRAVKEAGMGMTEMQKIMYSNCAGLLSK